MMSHEGPGFWRRLLAAFGAALKRGILGKSSADYVKQFTGSDAYWDRALAAQLGWPQKSLPNPDPDRLRSPATPVVRVGASVREAACRPPGAGTGMAP
jgi:hypothetical protein